MDIAEQHLVLRLWQDYLGDRKPTNGIVREFYLDVIKPSDLYFYGVAYEVFDVLTNGVFDVGAAESWNGRGILEKERPSKQAHGAEHALATKATTKPTEAA